MNRECARLPTLSSHHYVCLWQLVIYADLASDQWHWDYTIKVLLTFEVNQNKECNKLCNIEALLGIFLETNIKVSPDLGAL